MKVNQELSTFDELPNAAAVSVQTVAALCGCSVSTVWNRAKRGDLPSPITIAGHARWNVGALRKRLVPEAM